MLTPRWLLLSKAVGRKSLRGIAFAFVSFAIMVAPVTAAQQTPQKSGVTIQGVVLSLDNKPVSEALVRLEQGNSTRAVETKTDSMGEFRFASVAVGSYSISAEKSGVRSRSESVETSAEKGAETINLVLQANASAAPVAQAMQFADEPNFAVAGVTDWTAVGGHGSDSTLRTSESLASETLKLEAANADHEAASVSNGAGGRHASEEELRDELAKAPGSFDANYRLGEFYLRAGQYAKAIPLFESACKIDPSNEANQRALVSAYEGAGELQQARERVHQFLTATQSAGLYRTAAELDEKAGDSLSAVHEYEQAAKLAPSEQNYFEWGSELLLHRAVWQAQEVFQQGVKAYPKSVRMQTAYGAALFAGARYEQAAQHVCSASDLDPDNSTPYTFMGRIQIAAPDVLPCIQPRLARFARKHPGDSLANYFYAMAMLKDLQQSPDEQKTEEAEALLRKAVSLDPKCSDAYLQLGVLSASKSHFDQAISFYTKAIEADPQLADAYYRLGVAYDRIGQTAKATAEFQLHDEVKQKQAEATEQQRREVKQFLVIQPGVASPGAP